jgi:hypothetical protein
MARAPSIVCSQKKTARSAWRFVSIRFVLSAPYDSFRQWPEKAVKVEEEAVRRNVHARKIPELQPSAQGDAPGEGVQTRRH